MTSREFVEISTGEVPRVHPPILAETSAVRYASNHETHLKPRKEYERIPPVAVYGMLFKLYEDFSYSLRVVILGEQR